jgi:hypothetical protein
MGSVLKFVRKQETGEPKLHELVERVRNLVRENFDCVGFDHPHLRENMVRRGKGMRDILETLRLGEGVKGPDLDKYGDLRIKLRRNVCGKRIQIVVAIREKDMTVITVF